MCVIYCIELCVWICFSCSIRISLCYSINLTYAFTWVVSVFFYPFFISLCVRVCVCAYITFILEFCFIRHFTYSLTNAINRRGVDIYILYNESNNQVTYICIVHNHKRKQHIIIYTLIWLNDMWIQLFFIKRKTLLLLLWPNLAKVELLITHSSNRNGDFTNSGQFYNMLKKRVHWVCSCVIICVCVHHEMGTYYRKEF